MHKLLKLLLAIAALVAVALWMLSAPETLPDSPEFARDGDVENGQIVFYAGGCASCHSAPKAEGWGFSAYAVPIVFFLLGGPVVVLVLRRLSSGGAGVAAMTPAPATPAIADEELERQLERELGEL